MNIRFFTDQTLSDLRKLDLIALHIAERIIQGRHHTFLTTTLLD